MGPLPRLAIEPEWMELLPFLSAHFSLGARSLMAHFERMLLSFLLVVLLAAFVNGCSTTSRSGLTPLRVEQIDRDRLTLVQSIAVAPPIWETEQMAQYEQVADRLNIIAGRELGLEIVDAELASEPILHPMKSKAALLAKAKKLGTDAVMFVQVLNFTERRGGSVGATEGAQVNLLFKLISTEDRAEIWGSSFYYHDQAVTDNLFRLSERMREVRLQERNGWYTAVDLVERGAQEAFRSFRQTRQEAFLQENISR